MRTTTDTTDSLSERAKHLEGVAGQRPFRLGDTAFAVAGCRRA